MYHSHVGHFVVRVVIDLIFLHRFDREICMGIPDEKARKQILAVLCKDFKLAEDINFDLVARLTPGSVFIVRSIFLVIVFYVVCRLWKVECV